MSKTHSIHMIRGVCRVSSDGRMWLVELRQLYKSLLVGGDVYRIPFAKWEGDVITPFCQLLWIQVSVIKVWDFPETLM